MRLWMSELSKGYVLSYNLSTTTYMEETRLWCYEGTRGCSWSLEPLLAEDECG